MDFAETDEQRLLRETVAGIAGRYGHRYYVAKARAGEKPDELWQALGRGGYLGVAVPEAYGGGGGGMAELAIICEELAAQGCPLLLVVVSLAIAVPIIARFGSDAQRAQWLPRLATGELKMAFAITEADAGSNSHRLTTTAVSEGDRWRISGSKHYISGADEAQAVLVVTRTGTDPASGRGRLSLFVVDLDAPGLERTLIPVEIVAPEKQFVLSFDRVEVAADRLLGVEGDGLRQVFCGLNPERIMSAATSVGLGRYALQRAVAYARERRVWDVPIGAHQGLSHPLADAKVQVELARLMAQKAAWCHDTGREAGEAANMAKYAGAEAALAALDRAIQVHGGNGLASEYGLADLWGITRLLRTAPVSREMVLNFIARHSLGLPESY